MSPLLTDLELRRAAGVFKVLGHPARVRIAFRLAQGPGLTQHQLLEGLPWAQSTIARHVGLMRQHGLVHARRHGNEVHLRLADDLVPQLLDLICHHLPGTAPVASATAIRSGGAH